MILYYIAFHLDESPHALLMLTRLLQRSQIQLKLSDYLTTVSAPASSDKGSNCSPRAGAQASYSFSASAADSGPSEKALSVIPFQASRQAASQTFKQYHRGHWFFTKPSAGLQKIKETFLPFWVATASASVQLHGAQLGFDTWVQRWNPQTRRSESRLETVWQWVTLERAFWEQRYTANDSGMQVYASYKYPRGEINKLRPGAAVQIARPFQNDDVVSVYDGSTRRVGPFQMKPAVALRFVLEWIRGEEERRARQYVKSSFRCDKVGELRMSLGLTTVRSSAVYVPAFVFRSTHFGSKLRTYVSGVSASVVTGTRALDEARVGLASGLAGGLVALASGAYATMSPLSIWVWAVAGPMTLTGLAAHYYPHLRSWWSAYWQQNEQTRQEPENRQAAWDPEWVRTYARLEEEFRQRDDSENARILGNQPRGSARDPRGYYAVMQVQPNATKQEIQAAYRGLAMQYHPDRVPDEDRKDAARKKFVAIQEAYSVLRDPVKRQQYDLGR